jgi:two-component sensor histidine kinase
VNLRLGSLAYVPMFQGNGKPQGVFTIIRQAPGKFTRDQLDLARVFAARVSDAVEHARLDEQTRRDAEAKAILLRELNHRVKNNLAGIVALLRLDEPANLPAGVRQWLGRVVDRVTTMSRTHDLFAGGIEHVPVGDLIEQTLMSLSVVKPERATVRTQMQSPDAAAVRLRTDRAVTLAMVLHELGYNALAHGVARRSDGGAGTVTIAVARNDDSAAPSPAPSLPRLSITITDDGPGIAEAGVETEPARDKDLTHGQGLVLVRGLVERELRGRFALGPAAAGDAGAIAVLEFPLLTEEIREVDE